MYLVDFVICMDLYFWCLDLSLRSAKGVNNYQVSPSANMRTAKGLLLTESILERWGSGAERGYDDYTGTRGVEGGGAGVLLASSKLQLVINLLLGEFDSLVGWSKLIN